MELLGVWIVAAGLVVWWAATWGRSVLWAIVGCIFLSPVIWAIVLLVMGRHPDSARA